MNTSTDRLSRIKSAFAVLLDTLPQDQRIDLLENVKLVQDSTDNSDTVLETHLVIILETFGVKL